MAHRFHTGTTGIAGDFVVVGNSSDVNNIWGSGGIGAGGTVMCWIKFDSFGQGSLGRFLDKDEDTNNGWGIYTQAGPAPGPAIGFFHRWSGADGAWYSSVGSPTIAAGTDYHVALTYNKAVGTAPVFTINGVVSTTNTLQSGTGAANSDVNDRLMIGQRINYERAYDGTVADMRMYSYMLSLAEIQTIHAARGADNMVRGLVRRYPMQARPGLGPGASPYVDSLENSVNATSITLTVPAHDDGDTLIMAVCAGGNGGTVPPNITTPGGWTLIVHADTNGSPPSWPAVAVYSRTASSEPGTYVVNDNQGTAAWGGCIVAYRGLSTTVDTQSSTTGTTASPVCPTVTPSGNALVLRVVAMDSSAQMPTIQGDFFPDDLQYGRHAITSAGQGNGMIFGFGYELWDGTATGTRTWSAVGSDEWVGLTIAFLHGDGRENNPVKDVSNNQGHARIWHRVVGEDDILTGC